MKWVGVFVVPLGALWFWQTHLSIPEVQRMAWVVADVPNGAKPHFDYGSALQSEGKLEQAIEEYKIALQFDPNYAGTHMYLGAVLSSQAKFDVSLSHMETSMLLYTNTCDIH